MSTEDEVPQSILDALRSDALTPDQRAEVVRGLQPLLGAGGAGGAGGASGASPPAPRPFSKVGIAAGGAVVVGLVVAAVWFGIGRLESGTEAVPVDPVTVDEGSSDARENAEQDPLGAPQVPTLDIGHPVVDAPTPPRDRASRRRRAPVPDSEDVGAEDPEIEHTLLAQARRVLDAAPAQALELAESHRARFPRGVLTQEREVIAIGALERLNRSARARRRAAAFAARWPASPYVSRLEEQGLLER